MALITTGKTIPDRDTSRPVSPGSAAGIAECVDDPSHGQQRHGAESRYVEERLEETNGRYLYGRGPKREDGPESQRGDQQQKRVRVGLRSGSVGPPRRP